MSNDENLKFNRRKRNDKYSQNIDEKSRDNYDYSEEYLEEDSYDRRPQRNNLGLLYKINIVAVMAFLGYVFFKGIFPLPYRIVIAVVLILLEFFITRRLSYGDRPKIFTNILMILITIICIGFIFLAMRLDISVNRMNKGQIKASSEYKNESSFNVYVSGMDTGGDLSQSSRSDVNIIATVNTTTGKVLLTSMPRDSYLRIAGGGNNEYDKLTHAGNYGVESSMQTLANALNIDIPYYARINFDSLIKLVDVLGGIEVENNQAFQSRITDYYFEQGKISLNGDQALAFVRERYNLVEGDADRGRNQEKVMIAMMKKAISPSSILNMEKILSVVEESVDTNIPSNKMIDILNSQLLKLGNIDTETQEIRGEGQYGLPSYAMPGYNLYMFVPYQESLDEARNKILEIMK